MYTMWQFPSNCNFYFNEPVEELADMAGMQMGCPGGVGILAVQALGATAVSLDSSEFITSAASGQVDAEAFVPFDMYVNLKIYEELPYAVLYNLPAAFPAAINQDSFNKLPEDLQKIVLDAASDIELKGIESYRDAQDSLLQTLGNITSVHVYTLPDAERALWANRMLPVLDGVVANYLTADEVAQLHAILARFE
jgi:TRAP-type C4-dicarboxylate transport system substrate-binding protein